MWGTTQWRGGSVVALAAGVVLVGLAARALAAAPVSAQGFPPKLHTEGRYIKDTSGKVVILRGGNRPGFSDLPDGWWDLPGGGLYAGLGKWDPDAVKANLDEMKRWGCNLLRLHTCVQWWKDNPSTYKDKDIDVVYPEPFRQMYKDVIGWAGERGIYVIVEFYNMTRPSPQDTLPWPPHSNSSDVIASREDFLRLWEGFARELSPYPNVLFEFYNEPHGTPAQEAEWMAFTQDAINAIRPFADNIIVVQWGYGCWVNLEYPPPGNPAGTLDWIEKYPLKGDNLLYSTHLYRNSGGGGSFAMRTNGGTVRVWERDDLLKALRIVGVEHVVKDLNKPLIIGEVGANMRAQGPDLDHELAWFKNILQIFNEWGIGYAAWAWDPEKHLAHGMIKDSSSFAGPNAAGQIFMDAVKQ